MWFKVFRSEWTVYQNSTSMFRKEMIVYYCSEMIKPFLARGYDEKWPRSSMKDISNTKQEEFVHKKFKALQDPNSIFVCTEHPSQKHLPKILKDCFPLLEPNTNRQYIYIKAICSIPKIENKTQSCCKIRHSQKRIK